VSELDGRKRDQLSGLRRAERRGHTRESVKQTQTHSKGWFKGRGGDGRTTSETMAISCRSGWLVIGGSGDAPGASLPPVAVVPRHNKPARTSTWM